MIRISDILHLKPDTLLVQGWMLFFNAPCTRILKTDHVNNSFLVLR